MRHAVLALLLSVSPATAWEGPGFSPWSLSLQEVRGGLSYNAALTFTRAGKSWKVEGSCTVMDPANRAWLTQSGKGTARISESGVRGTLDRLGGFYVNGQSIVFGSTVCPSGEYMVGTGD
jgi:hypothetical protein